MNDSGNERTKFFNATTLIIMLFITTSCNGITCPCGCVCTANYGTGKVCACESSSSRTCLSADSACPTGWTFWANQPETYQCESIKDRNSCLSAKECQWITCGNNTVYNQYGQIIQCSTFNNGCVSSFNIHSNQNLCCSAETGYSPATTTNTVPVIFVICACLTTVSIFVAVTFHIIKECKKRRDSERERLV